MGFISSLAMRTSFGSRLSAKYDQLKGRSREMKAEIATMREEVRRLRSMQGHPAPASAKRGDELRTALPELLAHDEMVRTIPDVCTLAARIVFAVADDDIMLKKSTASHYLRTGFSALDSIRRCMPGLGAEGPRSVLDFGCGYGRVLRILRAAWPEAAITACDLMPDGLAFCMEHFGVCGFRSKIGPVIPQLAHRFDLIWAGSVVTHLPAPMIAGFIRLWRDLLAPGGHMVFTGHGTLVSERLERGELDYGLTREGVAAVIAAHRSAGFGYADYPGTSGYGVSVMTEPWLRSLADGVGGMQFGKFLPNFWDNHQDVWCFSREGGE